MTEARDKYIWVPDMSKNSGWSGYLVKGEDDRRKETGFRIRSKEARNSQAEDVK